LLIALLGFFVANATAQENTNTKTISIDKIEIEKKIKDALEKIKATGDVLKNVEAKID
jgi:hypothetical protein